MQDLPAAARLAAWGGAALAGSVSLDDAAARVAGPADAPHRVFGLPGESAGVNIAYALGRLRATGVPGLRLVLPRPGDVAGLPGPPAFNERAVARGATVLTVGGGTPLAVLDESRGAWTVHAVDPDPRTPLGLREAERELGRLMREATDLLMNLDVARWEPAAAEILAHQSSQVHVPALPMTFPPRAHYVLETAQRVALIVETARASDGGAVSAAEARVRSQALRELDAAARRGIEAACSAPVT
jgi:hypothetical protein